MDKTKHKDGMLAAGKKRLEQFRQKKGKGSSSKAPKVEKDRDHTNLGIDLEAGIDKDSKLEGQTTSENAKSVKSAQHPLEECRVEMEQRCEVFPTHSSELSVQHTSSDVSVSVGYVENTRIETSAISKVGSHHSMDQEGNSTSLTGHSSEFNISISSYSDDSSQDSGVTTSLSLEDMDNIQEVPSVLVGNDNVELRSKVKHADSESNDLQLIGNTVIVNTSEIAGKKENVVVEDQMDSRNLDVDVVDVPQNEVEDRIHASKEEEMLNNDVVGVSQNQVQGEGMFEPEMSFDTHTSTAGLPTIGLNSLQECHQGLLPGISFEDSFSFNSLGSSDMKSDGNAYGEDLSKQFQENPQVCKEEGTSSPTIGPEIGINGESVNIEDNNNCSPAEITTAVYDEHSPASGSDSSISIPVNPAGDLNSVSNDNHDIPSSEYAANVLKVQKDEGRLELEVEFREAVVQTSAESEKKSNKTIDDTHSNVLHSDYVGETSVSQVTVNMPLSDTLGQHSDNCQLELNEQSSIGIITRSVSPAPVDMTVCSNLHQTEIRSVQLETDPSVISERCENAFIETCETSECLTLDIQTDRVIEHDALNNFTDTEVLDKKTLEKEANQIETQKDVRIMEGDVLTNDAGSLDQKEVFVIADLILDGNAVEQAKRTFAGYSDLVYSTLESNAEDSSGSMESCKDTESNVRTGKVTDEVLMPSSVVYVEKTLDKVEATPTSEEVIETSLSSELLKTDIVASKYMGKTDTLVEDVPNVLDLSVNCIEEIQSKSEQMIISAGSVVVEDVMKLHFSTETEEKCVTFLKQEMGSINQEEESGCIAFPAEIDLGMKFHALERVESLNGATSASGVELPETTEDILNTNASKIAPDRGEHLFAVESELIVIVPHKTDGIEENIEVHLEEEKDIQFDLQRSSEIWVDDSRSQILNSGSASQIYFERGKNTLADASFSSEHVSSQGHANAEHDANLSLMGIEGRIKMEISPCTREVSADANLISLTDNPLNEQEARPSLGPSSIHSDLHKSHLDPEHCVSELPLLVSKKNQSYFSAQKEDKVNLNDKEAEEEGLQLKFKDGAAKITDETERTFKVLMHVVGRLRHLVDTRVRPIDQNSRVSNEVVLSSACLDILEQESDAWIDTLQESLEEGRQMESTVRQLQDELSRREAHVAEVTTEFTELSQNFDDLQKDLNEKMKAEKKVQREFTELSQNYEDLQKNLEETMKMEKEAREELVTLSQNYECLQKNQAEKMSIKMQLSQLEDLLSVRDTDIENLSNQISELSHSYNMLMIGAAKSTKEKDLLEAELEHLKSLCSEQKQMHLKMCLQASTLSERVSSAVNIVDDSEHVNTDSIGTLEIAVNSLLEKYEVNYVELKILSQRALEMDAAHKVEMDSLKSFTISQQEELNLMHRELEILTNELTNAREETSQQIETKEGHLKQLAELSRNYEELQRNLGERLHIESKVGQLEDLLSIKEGDIQKLSKQLDEINAEVTKISEEKIVLEGDLKNIQTVYADHEELYSRMCIQASALSQRIIATLGEPNQVEDIDGDAMVYLEYAVGSLLEQHGAYSAEVKLLSQKISDSAIPSNEEENDLNALMNSKEIEISSLNDQIRLLMSELSRTKEESEQKVQQAEEKLIGVREKLSMAVTKGKALLQQKDNLKQLLAEKTAELDDLGSSYKHELQAKDSALSEAYSKVKHFSESVDRVDALESELSYIRNSANALRESFLQKDAMLQKIEELLEDSNIPEEIQFKDIFEKLDFLIEAYSQRNLMHEGQSQMRELDESPSADLVSQTQEIEELNRRCDDLLRKYRGMAEQSEMLEQSLVERNIVIQKWEEVLDSIEMSPTVRSKEPEDRIKWLGKEVSDSYARTAHLQQEVENLKVTTESLNNTVEKLQEENDKISAELKAKEEELKMTVMDLENMTSQFNSISRSPCQGNAEIGFSKGLFLDETQQEKNEQTQSFTQSADLESLVASFPTMLGDVVQAQELKIILSAPSLSIAIGQLIKFLGENCRDLMVKIKEAKAEVEKLLASNVVGKEIELELSELREELSLKTISESNLCLQLEEFHKIKAALENEVNQSQLQVKEMAEKNSLLSNEIAKLTMEASQAEEKLASVREKLSLAVKKGKGVVQQRDVLKQSLEEKIAELNKAMKAGEAGEMALKKAEQNVKHLVQRVDILEAELLTSKDRAVDMERSLQESNRMFQKFAEAFENLHVIGAPHSGDIIQNIQWLSETVIDAERKVRLSEQEAHKSRKGVELLALEVEETQGRLDALNEELKLAERNIAILIEDKKKVEATKAETVFRLEHAMANINSLLFELTQSKESVGKLERENRALSAQLEELEHKQAKSLEQLKDFPDVYSKLHSLKDCQSSLLKMFANECLKLAEDMKGSDALAVRLSRQFPLEGQTTNVTFNDHQGFMKDSYPTTWESEVSLSHEDWKQGVDTGSMKLLCETMESELQDFSGFFNNFIAAASQDSVAMSQLLLRACDEIHLISQKMKNLATNADLSMSRESLIFEKDKEIANLDLQSKAFVGRVKALIEELEGIQKQVQVKSSNNSRLDILVSGVPSTDLEKLAHSLVVRLDCAVKDLSRYVGDNAEIEKQNQELRSQLADAESIFNRMDEQRQQDNLKIIELQKSLEDFEVNAQRIYEELHSHQDILLTKRQEELKLVEALNQAETQVAELSARVEELQKSKQDLEASLSKASSRFSTTVNNFNNFKRLAEKLIEEAQGQHLLLEGRDAQISQLRDEIASKRTEITSLRNAVDDKTMSLSQIYKEIREIIRKDDQSIELPTESDLQLEVNSIHELLGTLSTRNKFRSEDLRIQLARKDALLQDMQMRHDDLAGKVNFLQASLQEKQTSLEERDSLIVPEQTGPSTQVDEMGSRAKLIVQPPAIVTRGRKVSASDQFVLDVDMQGDRSLLDSTDDDKGHTFKPLTASRLIPRGARFLVDRIDGFWVSGERLLMRRPEARLSVMLYWVILHIWMTVLLF